MSVAATRRASRPPADPPADPPVLLACSHGTSSPAGRRAVRRLADAVAARRPDLDVRLAFVDVQQPDVPTALTGLGGRSVRLVPLLLSAGYHVKVDLAQAAGATAGVTVTAALGPDPRLVRLLVARLREAGLRPDDTVVMAAAGSSDAGAVAHCELTAGMLAAALGTDVRVGFISAAAPRLADAVHAARAAGARRGEGARVLVATYLLAPGYFADLAGAAGADAVAAPLLVEHEAPPSALVDLVLERYQS